MATPTLSSISPTGGPPGSEITCTGTGFDTGARVGCPVLVPTTFVSSTELRATVPADLAGPAGGEMAVSVYVRNEGGEESNELQFTVKFDVVTLQAYTTVDAVAREIPGFQRGGQISDITIEAWIQSIAQGINGILASRGLPLAPSEWPAAAAGSAQPAASSVLENINRLGAAARLANAVGAQFSTGEWPLAKSLTQEYTREVNSLRDGRYDKLFKASAATFETGKQVSIGDMTSSDGAVHKKFQKDQVF